MACGQNLSLLSFPSACSWSISQLPLLTRLASSTPAYHWAEVRGKTGLVYSPTIIMSCYWWTAITQEVLLMVWLRHLIPTANQWSIIWRPMMDQPWTAGNKSPALSEDDQWYDELITNKEVLLLIIHQSQDQVTVGRGLPSLSGMNKWFVKSLTAPILGHLWCLEMSEGWVKYTTWIHFWPRSRPFFGQTSVKIWGGREPLEWTTL